jgi:hypothetical protein
MSNGRLVGTGEFMRRMPPPLGGLALKWSGRTTWIEGLVTFGGPQRRFNGGDLTDARIGGVRTPNAIATYFTGTATDTGLVRNGLLVATGETLAEVQTRVLGNASTGYLYTAAPGYVVLGARAGWRLSPQIDLIVMGDNLTDRNYRPFGSGVACGRRPDGHVATPDSCSTFRVPPCLCVSVLMVSRALRPPCDPPTGIECNT